VDKKLEELLASLPPKPPRSRLAPYAGFICELRERGWTYRGITKVLAEKCGVRVSPSNVHHFVRINSLASARGNQRPMARPSAMSPERTVAPDELSQRIAGLKQSRRPSPPSTETDFEFDTAEPLRIKKL
jgi:hypothetical protein